MLEYDTHMIFTVFPSDPYYPPQDFSTYTAAVEYAQSLPCDDAEIHMTEGDVV